MTTEDLARDVPAQEEKPAYTERQVRAKLAELRRVDGLTKTARRLNVSSSYLCDVLAGRVPMGPRILEGMGLRKVIRFELAAEAGTPA